MIVNIGAVMAYRGKRLPSRRAKLQGPLGGHVWTAPAVQEESDYQRSVRVRSCLAPPATAQPPPVLFGVVFSAPKRM
jgi:hypothetical protein